MPYRLSYQAISVGAGHFEKREKREKSSDQARNVELLPGYITGGFRLQLTKIVDCTTDLCSIVFQSIIAFLWKPPYNSQFQIDASTSSKDLN